MALRDRGEQFSMVDQKSQTYRPRRAYVEPEVQPVEPDQPVMPYRDTARYVTPRAADQDRPTPLYRDETPPNGTAQKWTPNGTPQNGWSTGLSAGDARAAATPDLDPAPTEGSLLRPTTSPARHVPSGEEEITTILPRSRPSRQRIQAPLDAIDDYGEDERKPLGRRAKLALLIGVVAAVIVIGLLIGYAVLGGSDQPASQPSVTPPAGEKGPSSNPSQPPDQSGTALLSDASMLSPAQAKVIDSHRSWKVALTQPNTTENEPTAACFGGEPVQGQPTPQQKILRVLQSSGKQPALALHEATAYNSPEEAIQAYTVASKTLGGCEVAGSYIASGSSVTLVGNQSLGVIVKVKDGKKTQAHSIVLDRSGRVMNVLDVAQPSQAIAMLAVAKALRQVNSVQCRAAGGECGRTVAVKDSPPPMGGDEPGFLTTGDLPPAGPKIAPWVAAPIEQPQDDFKGSGCENVNWATISAKSKSSRVYLIQASGKNFFGLNEVVLTTKNAKAATKQVDQIKSALVKCKDSTLTASVTRPHKVTSIGAEGTRITGWTTVVSQKSIEGTARYRVGIVSAGPKVIYTFLNPRADYDFTNRQWNTVAVRAGERTTQVN
jgi:hypothetical protein